MSLKNPLLPHSDVFLQAMWSRGRYADTKLCSRIYLQRGSA